MQDRVPLYPGRVTLTPVSGQANTFDLTRADQPTQEGTPLNKASLLKDATAALYGKTAEAVPDDLLSVLSKSVLAQVNGKYTKHVGTNADRPVGSTVTLNVGGTPYEFIVVHQGKPSSIYDDSCNGTWLLMKDIHYTSGWNRTSTVTAYASSYANTYLNGPILNLFDDSVKTQIKQVKVPYFNGSGDSGVATGANGLSCKVFLLSGYEVGFTTNFFPVDGTKLAYFEGGTSASANAKRIATQNGSGADWWLRSPDKSNSMYVNYVYHDGNHSRNNPSASYGLRPCIILPSDVGEYIYYTDSFGNIYTEQEYETKLTDVLGNLISIPAGQIKDGVKIATGSYTGTGTYGSSNPNSLTFGFVPKLVFVTYDPYKDQSDFILFIDTKTRGSNLPSNNQILSTWSGNTLSWYNPNNADYQYNGSGKIGHYIAIG